MNISQADVYGRNALVYSRIKEIFQLLIATGKFGNDDICNIGRTWEIINFADEDCLIWFVETYKDFIDINRARYYSPLMWACIDRKQKFFEYLLTLEGIDINFDTEKGDTALFDALSDSMQAAKLLLQRDDINFSHVNNQRQNALMLACYNQSFDAVKGILSKDV